MQPTRTMTCAEEWLEAICQILADARDLWGLAAKAHYPSYRRPHTPGPDSSSPSENGQLLLPGIANPHRWDFGREG